MNNKKVIIIPSLSKFENVLGIYNREIKGAVFIPNKTNYQNLSSLESTLSQLRYLKIVGWFTNEKGFQRGRNRIKKLFDLYSRREIDVVICYSQEDLLILENTVDCIKSCGANIYYIKDCIIIKDNEIIPLS